MAKMRVCSEGYLTCYNSMQKGYIYYAKPLAHTFSVNIYLLFLFISLHSLATSLGTLRHTLTQVFNMSFRATQCI